MSPTFNQRMEVAEAEKREPHVHHEYPKRVYPHGKHKGVTVNSSAEEAAAMASTNLAAKIAAKSQPAPAPAAVAEAPDDKAKEAEAIDFLVTKGYSKKEAKQLVTEQGVDTILAVKVSDAEEQRDAGAAGAPAQEEQPEDQQPQQ